MGNCSYKLHRSKAPPIGCKVNTNIYDESYNVFQDHLKWLEDKKVQTTLSSMYKPKLRNPSQDSDAASGFGDMAKYDTDSESVFHGSVYCYSSSSFGSFSGVGCFTDSSSQSSFYRSELDFEWAVETE